MANKYILVWLLFCCMYMYFVSTYIHLFVHPQQDVIGQNLADITHPESAVEITDNLKPAATPPTSMVEESIVSQFRQFYVRFRSTVSPNRMQLSRFTSHTVSQAVCVGGEREREKERKKERERAVFSPSKIQGTTVGHTLGGGCGHIKAFLKSPYSHIKEILY